MKFRFFVNIADKSSQDGAARALSNCSPGAPPMPALLWRCELGLIRHGNLGGIIPHLLQDIRTARTPNGPTGAIHTLRDQFNRKNLNFIACHTVSSIQCR